jgi:hypothetical protein
MLSFFQVKDAVGEAILLKIKFAQALLRAEVVGVSLPVGEANQPTGQLPGRIGNRELPWWRSE